MTGDTKTSQNVQSSLSTEHASSVKSSVNTERNDTASSSFVHLHVHSEYSLLDGLSKIRPLVKKAKSLGMKALALTDHGVCYGLVDFYNACKKEGIKPILGVEAYVASGSRFDKNAKKGEERYSHLILLVKNETGYKNLCRLVTRSNTEGFYYKPRIDFDLLKQFHEGLICLSACIAGEVPKAILRGDFQAANEIALKYKDLFGEDYYLEVQNHGIPEERMVMNAIFQMSAKLGIKVVATNDVHYIDSEDAKAHEWLLCLQTDKKITDAGRMVYHGDYSLKSEEEMRSLFPSALQIPFPDIIANTVEVADKCNFEFEFGHYRMPHVDVPAQYKGDYFAYLSALAWDGFEMRFPVGHPERDRAGKDLSYELSVVKQMGFAEYFLDTRKTIKWAKSNGILVGPGRGCAAAGTLVYTSSGIKRIEKVRAGDYVLDCKGMERRVFHTHAYQASESILTIEDIGGGRVSFTKDHRFFISRDKKTPEWKRADEIQKGDCLLMPLHKQEKPSPTYDLARYIPAKEMTDYTLEDDRIYFRNKYSFSRFVSLDKDLAYILGLMEGYMESFHTLDYSEFLSFLLTGRTKNMTAIMNILHFGNTKGVLIPGIPSNELPKPFVNLLSELNGPGMDFMAYIPLVCVMGRDIKASYILGVIDGGYENDSVISQMIYDRDCAFHLKTLLYSMHIPCRIRENQRENPFSSNGSDWIITYSKEASLAACIAGEKNRECDTENGIFFSNDYAYIPVTRITEHSYRGYVYDLTVETENEPSYCTSECVVHNSGAGSRLCYCLEITDVDPIKYGLLFERFLNPERVSMPDIDVDYDYSHKSDVVSFEADSNGHDHFAKIQTLVPVLAKGVLRDCARIAGYPPSVGARFAKLVPDVKDVTLEMAYDMEPEIEKLLQEDPGYREMWEIAKKLEGTKKAAGTHACGHIPTPVPCEELFPCSVDTNGYLVCQYDMVEAEHLGNLKKDLLMLRNLTIIDVAAKLIRERYGEEVPLWTEEVLNDQAALDMISSGDTNGVFQIESEGMKGFMRNLKPSCFEDIIAGISLYRPGPMKFIPDYVEGKQHPENIRYLVPQLEPILKNTYNVMIYQEQVMQIVQKLAGFSMGRADIVRKAMGKKKMDVMEEERRHFIYGDASLKIPGCIANGIPEAVAVELFDRMADFANYAFNKSHAAAYGAITMQTAYLKAHYPLEFASGLLSSVMDKTDKLSMYISELRSKGYEILPPDINTSDANFTPVEGKISYGLASIKSVSMDVVNRIIEERGYGGPFRSYYDFLYRCYKIGKKPFEVLIKAGALDFCSITRRTMLQNLNGALKAVKEERKSFISGQMTIFDMIPEEQKTEVFLEKNKMTEYPEYPPLTILQMEKEVSGLYISGNPLDQYRHFIHKAEAFTELIYMNPSDDGEYFIHQDDYISIAGIVVDKKIVYTKKGSKQMAFVTIDDGQTTARVILFPEAYARRGMELEEDDLFLVKGKVSMKDGECSLIADKMVILNKDIQLP